MSATSSDPLASLVVDVNEVDRARIAETLTGLVNVDKGSGRVVLSRSFDHMDAKSKVLIYVLGMKAAHLLGMRDEEHVSPKDLAANTGIPPGTVRPKLAELLDLRLVSKNPSGEYIIAPHQIGPVLDYIEQKRSIK